MKKESKSFISLVFILFLLVLTGVSAYSSDLYIDYLDGFLDIKTPGGWEELFIGDEIPSGSIIKLDMDSVAELSSGSSVVTLSKEGTYRIDDLLNESNKMSSAGFGNLIAGKLENMVRESDMQEASAVGGVRAAEVDTGDDLEWISSETEELLETGKNLLSQEKYEEALGVFREALDFSDFDEESEVYFYLGLTYDLMGKPGRAISNLNSAELDSSTDFYHDLAILKGKLLVQTFDYEGALSWLDDYISANKNNMSAEDQVQTARYLSAFAYSGLGEVSKAKETLQETIRTKPNSDTAEAAKSFLNKL